MINLIPMPENLKEKKGFFTLDLENVKAFASKEFAGLEKILGIKTLNSEDEAVIKIKFCAEEKAEAYSLEIEEEEIEIEASDRSGAFYALQSLRQLILMSEIKEDKVRLSCLEIKHDSPAYGWRGLQLDESRHFFGKETVKKLLDFMALYKLNRFHWHLTDDQGWRIEIEKYPLLTEIGSKRTGSQLHHWNCMEMDMTAHEGFYSKEDIREIVEYAKERCIEIVPEIDFPAHSAAAIASYNSLACREIPCEVFNFFGGIFPHKQGMKNWNRTLCLGKDEVLQFVFDVIDEVVELFPFGYFHVGGDEAPTYEWKGCPKCQERIKKEGLRNEVELQGWFTNRLNEYLRKKGKTMIGWNEVLAAKNIDTDVVAQYWTPQKDNNVNAHLDKGGRVILSNHKYFYFDMLYTYCTVKGTYNYSPKTVRIAEKNKKGVLGVEAELWSEWIDEENELFFKLWHRGLALSETAWCKPSQKNYGEFRKRLQQHKKIADASGFYYGDDTFTLKPNGIKKTVLAKKNGFSIKDFDSEYRLNEIMKK
ncbi:MAG: beta-N-acetylhexosaminidase [Clostridia bacterium]|nr:beta-N-acetylhexosaminidase [Clostridia bacterium]